MRYPVVLSFALAVVSCGKDHPTDDNPPDGVYELIELDPAQAQLTVALGATATQDYKVFGTDGGERIEITADCALGIDSEFGQFAGATATVRARGGKATVTASCGTQAASGSLVVNVTGLVVVGTTQSNAPDLFAAATLGTDAARAPLIEYPLEKAVSPKNIPSIDTQWTASGNDLFHERLQSTFVTVDVYTAEFDAMLTAADWTSIAQTAAGEMLSISVEGLATADPTMKFASATRVIEISTDDIDQTAIYYWASSAGNIMSQVFGVTTPPSLVKDDCTSCHSLSRNGDRIGYSRCVGFNCGELYAGFLKYDQTAMAWTESVNANDKQIRGSYTTFGSPFSDDAKAASIVSMSTGTLQLYDPDTGAMLPSNLAVANTALPGGSALMADWSADNAHVVYTATPNANQWIDLSGGRIAQMTYAYDAATNAHTFGTPEMLVPDPITLPTGTYDNFFFPSYSPDGALIVLNASRGQWRTPTTNARDPGSRLMLADAAKTFVVDMAAMNGGNDLDITWAHWAPNTTTDYYWVVFSSERDYGHKITVANSAPACKANGVQSCKQIWIGAIAKNRLTGATTIDPSAAPMWLPGQDTQTTNISPYWTRPVGLQ